MGELADRLWDLPIGTSVAQLHGCICGLHCADPEALAEHRFRSLTDLLADEIPDIDTDVVRNELELFSSVATDELDDEELAFEPLISDDDAALIDRLTDLSEWCGGFLVGFGQAAERNAPTEEEQEILADIVAIAQVDPESTAGEQAEFELFQVVEHLRTGVLILRLGSASGVDDDAG